MAMMDQGADLLAYTERFGPDELVVVESDAPVLGVDTTLRQASRGRGQVQCVACSSDAVYVATTRGYILRYHWDDYGNEKVSEVEVVRHGTDAQLMAMWCDPTANHLVISVRVQGTAEVHYLHRKWTKARALTKLRGTHLTALAWPPLPPAAADSTTSASGRESDPVDKAGAPTGATGLTASCTGCMLLGTDTGLLHELVIEEAHALKKEPGPPRQLMDLKDRRKRVCGVAQEMCADGSLLVVVATPLALYVLRGPEGCSTLDTLMAAFANVPLMPALEAMLPAVSFNTSAQGGLRLPHSQLQLYHAPDAADAVTETLRFGWLVGAMVYHGEVVTAPLSSAGGGGGGNRAGARAPGLSPSSLGPSALPGRGNTPPPSAAIQPQVSIPAPDALLRNVCLLPLVDVFDGSGGGAGGGGGGGAGGGGVGSLYAGGTGPLAGSSAVTPPAGGSPRMAGSAALLGGGTPGPEEDEIRDMVMTEWHFVVVEADRLRAINRVSGLCAAERVFRSPVVAHGVSGESTRTLDGLVLDPVSHTMYMYSDESLYEVQLRQETQGLWRVFMELQDWDSALRMCSSNAQRDVVHAACAEAAMTAHDYDMAAVHFAKVVGGQPPFEDVTLRFIEAEASGALMLFLSTRLACLSKADRAQSTMLAAWLLELQLDKLNRMLLESGRTPTAEYAAAEASLHSFVSSYVEVLDPGTTVGLLVGAGRTDELLVYAQARGDHAAVLEALLQQPDGAQRALAVLRKPSCPVELVYRFAPGLIVAAPGPSVDLLISTRPPLEPRQLIPALLRFAEPGASPTGRQAVLRYVSYAVDVLSSQDSAVHDLAAALHSLEDGEAGLLAYIARARGPTGAPLYNTKYVLRLAVEHGKRRAEVKLLCELGMYEDAVARALQVDLALAQAVAGSPPEEEMALRHRLWLAVAKHVVQGGPGVDAKRSGTGGATAAEQDQVDAISKAVQLLKEAGGLLKIEDVLPFFPDFVTIDNFKEAICDSLERYNKQIDELKAEMEEATDIADAVRRDLKALGGRAAVVRLSEPCARCGAPLADTPPGAATAGLPTGGAIPPFFVFPTGLVYHGACCAAEVCELAPASVCARVALAMAQLAKMRALDDAAQGTLRQLTEDIAAEDPRNGSLLVNMVDAGFVAPGDPELASWAL